MILREPGPTPCVVIDITSYESMASTPHGGAVKLGLKAPTVLHFNREIAEREALRLAARFPGHHFLVLEATLIATAVKVPTHITLSGRVVAESLRPALVDIADDGLDLPF